MGLLSAVYFILDIVLKRSSSSLKPQMKERLMETEAVRIDEGSFSFDIVCKHNVV